MTDIIDEVQERALKATPLPYSVSGKIYLSLTKAYPETSAPLLQNAPQRHETADFIVSLVNAWPQLRDRLRAAEAVCEAAVADLKCSYEAEKICFATGAKEFLDMATKTELVLISALEAWRKARGEGG